MLHNFLLCFSHVNTWYTKNLSQLHAVLGNFWQNLMLAPSGGLAPPPTGDPGSAPVLLFIFVFPLQIIYFLWMVDLFLNYRNDFKRGRRGQETRNLSFMTYFTGPEGPWPPWADIYCCKAAWHQTCWICSFAVPVEPQISTNLQDQTLLVECVYCRWHFKASCHRLTNWGIFLVFKVWSTFNLTCSRHWQIKCILQFNALQVGIFITPTC